jgi:hypothetical protein
LVGELARCVDGCQQSTPDQETLQCFLDARCDEFPEAIEECTDGGEEPPDPQPRDAGVDPPEPDVFVNEPELDAFVDDPNPNEATCEATCRHIIECLPNEGFPLEECINGCISEGATQEEMECLLAADCDEYPEVFDRCTPGE